MSQPLKIARKVVLYFVLFLLIAVGGLTIYLRFNKEKIEQKILTSINQRQSGYLIYEGLVVSTTGSFPLVSLTFESLTYYESRDTTQVPILLAENFSVVPNLTALVKGDLIIDKVSISGVELNLQEDENRELNLSKALIDPRASSGVQVDSTAMNSPALIDIQSFSLQNASFHFNAYDSDENVFLSIEDLYGELHKAADQNQIEVDLISEISELQLSNIDLKNTLVLDLTTDLILNPDRGEFFVNDLSLILNEITLSLENSASDSSKPVLELRSEVPLELLVELAKDFDFVGDGLEVESGNMTFFAQIEGVSDHAKIQTDFSLSNTQAFLDGKPISLDMIGAWSIDLEKDLWDADLSDINFSFKKNELSGAIKLASKTSDHFDIWTDIDFNLQEENAADSIYALMNISSIFSIDVLPSGELTFNDSTELKAAITTARFNRQTLGDAEVHIKPQGERLHLDYNTISSEVNDIDMQLTFGPFYQKALLPSLETIPFLLDLKAQNIDLAYLELEELQRIANLDLRVDGSVDGIEGKDMLSINLDLLDLFVTDDSFDIELDGDFAVLIDTTDVILKSDALDIGGTLSDLTLKDAEFVLGDTITEGALSIKTAAFDLNSLGELLLVDSTHFLMNDSSHITADMSLSASMTKSDRFNIDTNGDLKYSFASNDYSVEEIDLELYGSAPEHIETMLGEVGVKGLHLNNYHEYPLLFNVNYAEPILDLEISSFEDMFEGEGNVKLQVELTDDPKVSLDYEINNLDLGQFWSQYQDARFIDGKANFAIELDTYLDHFFDSLNGKADITGQEWQLYGFDLDEILKDYKRSQNFQLKDVGAFFVMGPFGPVMSKGYDFSRLVSIDTLGSTQISSFNANWHVKNGELFADDMAFATNKNRVAAKGSIDFENRAWNHLKIAVLDKKGCSLLEQEVDGPFKDPTFSDINVIGTLLGSVINVLKIASFQKCDPFYTGKVRHPY